jgi:hypothetical protein
MRGAAPSVTALTIRSSGTSTQAMPERPPLSSNVSPSGVFTASALVGVIRKSQALASVRPQGFKTLPAVHFVRLSVIALKQRPNILCFQRERSGVRSD